VPGAHRALATLLWLVSLVACEGRAAPRAASAEDTRRAGWEEIAAAGEAGLDSPTAGEDAAIAYDGVRHRLWLYGGKGDDDVNRNELWSFDVGTRRWERARTGGTEPPPREDHTLVLDRANDQLVLFGGEDGDTSNETWVCALDTLSWREITSPTAPSLESHVAIYDPRGQRMVVQGGMREKGGEKDLSEEVWSLDLRRAAPTYGTWSVLETSGAGPRPRREHEGLYDPVRHRLLVFGGRQRSNSSYLCDLFELDLASSTWREIETHGDRPNPVRQTATGYDPDANELTVFGGEVLNYMAGHEKDAKEFPVNEIWVLRLDTGEWTERTPYPPSVYDHVGIFVPEYGSTLIYGGSGLHSHKEHSTWLIRDLARGEAPPEGTR